MTIWETLIVSLLSAMAGGSLTGYFTLRATKEAHQNELRIENERRDGTIQGVLQAIHDEVQTLLDRYQDTMGARMESLEANQPLLSYWPVSQEYFPVYKANSALLGMVDDSDLRKAIVKMYTLASALLDSFRFNNEMVAKWEQWMLLYQETGNELHRQTANQVLVALRNTQHSSKKGMRG